MKIVYERGQVLGKHGVRFLEESGQRSGRQYQAIFECGKCSAVFICDISSIKNNKTVSCGCFLRKQKGLSRSSVGGKDALYGAWHEMKRRCKDSSHIGFHRYGGRGIKVCIEWEDNFLAFREWALSSGWKEGLQIDRKENDGNYDPSNCRFLTPKENARNRSNNVFCKLDGVRMTLVEASEKLGVSKSTMSRWSKGKCKNKFEDRFVFEDPINV